MKSENSVYPLKSYEEMLIKDFESHSQNRTKEFDDEFEDILASEMDSVIKKRKFVILKTYEFERFLQATSSKKKSKPRLLDFSEFNEFLENAN